MLSKVDNNGRVFPKPQVKWADLMTTGKTQPPLRLNEHGTDVAETKTMQPAVKSDLYYALFPIYHLSKIWGLLPVRFVKQRGGRCLGQKHLIDILYGCLLLLFLIVAEVWGLWRDLRDGWENSTRLKSETAVTVTCGDVLAVMIMAAVSVLGSPFRWDHLQNVMNMLVEVDEKLGMVSPKKTCRFAIIIIVCTLTYLITISIVDIYTWDFQAKKNKKMHDKGAINYAPIYFMYTIVIIMELQYTLATYNIGIRFARLNKNLENLLKSGQISDYLRKDIGLGGIGKVDVPGRMVRKTKISDWLVVGSDSRGAADTISQLVTVHSSLCDSVLLLNSAFGLPILAVTLTCILHLIITPYFLIIEANSDRHWLFVANQCFWCILHIGRMLIVVQPCYVACTESKATAVLVSQLLSTNWDPESRKQLEVFSLQLLHRPLDFSACGLFSVDRALVTSIAGAVTTYLVILIQFQKADDTKDATDVLKNVSQFIKNGSVLQNATTLQKLI
ncbi:gustatory receptor for sugar taste 43a [Orussus abietinus]|uniref:gustatory receptor for sugar taste 43a n=1 Tax=Orussus abietinus TaxID=222816 RepID=UPI0006259FAC|nr:gustatory receptor for sugar taste 43a [Orussus abietinus]